MDLTRNFICELETKYQFTYLEKLSFESDEEKDFLQKKGLLTWKDKEAGRLGDLFIDLIERSFMPLVSIRWVDPKIGYGVFAEEEIKEGDFVGEYTGVIRRNDLRRCFEPPSDFIAMYPIEDERGKKFLLDAIQGNMTRFINHKRDGNIAPYQAFYEGLYHRIFRALRVIRKGEQLFYDYGRSYWYSRSSPIDLI